MADNLRRMVRGPIKMAGQSEQQFGARKQTLYQEHLRLNRDTIARIVCSIDPERPRERLMLERMRGCVESHGKDSKHMAFFQLQAKAYEKQAIEEHGHEIKARQEKRRENFSCNKKGHKAIRKALGDKATKPLQCLIRDKVGPDGQPIGTYTTNPNEIDGITQRAWNKIYDGNCSDNGGIVRSFLGKYHKDIFKRSEYQLHSVNWESLKATCIHAKHTVAGMDGFTPSDLTLLSDDAFWWLAELLELVEGGQPWPEQLTHARAAFLAKDPDRPEDPLAYRVLLVLPALYRRWASMRLADLEPWIQEWQLDEMFAGVPGVGAEDAWWCTSLQLESLWIQGTPVIREMRTFISASIRWCASWSMRLPGRLACLSGC